MPIISTCIFAPFTSFHPRRSVFLRLHTSLNISRMHDSLASWWQRCVCLFYYMRSRHLPCRSITQTYVSIHATTTLLRHGVDQLAQGSGVAAQLLQGCLELWRCKLRVAPHGLLQDLWVLEQLEELQGERWFWSSFGLRTELRGLDGVLVRDVWVSYRCYNVIT